MVQRTPLWDFVVSPDYIGTLDQILELIKINSRQLFLTTLLPRCINTFWLHAVSRSVPCVVFPWYFSRSFHSYIRPVLFRVLGRARALDSYWSTRYAVRISVKVECCSFMCLRSLLFQQTVLERFNALRKSGAGNSTGFIKFFRISFQAIDIKHHSHSYLLNIGVFYLFH